MIEPFQQFQDLLFIVRMTANHHISFQFFHTGFKYRCVLLPDAAEDSAIRGTFLGELFPEPDPDLMTNEDLICKIRSGVEKEIVGIPGRWFPDFQIQFFLHYIFLRMGLTYGEDDDPDVEVPASIPVGYETQITLHSLDFEEFLWAYGYDGNAIAALRSYYESGERIPDALNDKYESLFREYMVVGGMPEVVADFVEHKDFNRVDRIQNDILAEYRDDISKHAKGKEKQLVRMCYDAVPKQLAKELKKFQYSTVEKKQTRRKYGGSVQWLKDSEIVNACYNTHDPQLPLMANANEDQFKLYINDTGLLCCMYGHETKLAVLNNSIKGNARGGIYENVISECLLKRGYTLYYFKPDTEHEIEFLIEKKGEVIPIEVKAGNNATASLNGFIDKYSPSVAYTAISVSLFLWECPQR